MCYISWLKNNFLYLLLKMKWSNLIYIPMSKFAKQKPANRYCQAWDLVSFMTWTCALPWLFPSGSLAMLLKNYSDIINWSRPCSEQTHCIGALIWSHREASLWSGLTVLESEQSLAWLYVSSLIEHKCQYSLKTRENVALQPRLAFSLDILINYVKWVLACKLIV